MLERPTLTELGYCLGFQNEGENAVWEHGFALSVSPRSSTEGEPHPARKGLVAATCLEPAEMPS